jgi:hypothetical protein
MDNRCYSSGHRSPSPDDELDNVASALDALDDARRDLP